MPPPRKRQKQILKSYLIHVSSASTLTACVARVGVHVGEDCHVLACVHHASIENIGLLLLPLKKQYIILLMILL